MQLLVSVVIMTCVYSVLGVGFVTIYKASRVLNFAFADMALLTGYLAATLIRSIGGPVILPIALSFLFSFALGLSIYRILIRPLVGESLLATIILTVAMGIILNAIAILIWKADIETITLGWDRYFKLPGNVRVSGAEIIIVLFTGVLFLLLGLFYRFSIMGRQMRATAENFLLSAQRGINIHLITGVAWGIGTFVTGAAGILIGAIAGVSLNIGSVIIIGLAVALVGGLDSLKGTIPAAFIVSLSERLINYYVNPRLSVTIPFVIMLLVLLIRPWGLFGTKEEIERV